MTVHTCQCGCGETTRIVRGKPNRFIHNHHARLQEQNIERYVTEDRGYETPCWIWQGFTSESGYGQVGRNQRAHRVMYEALRGPIPAGLELDHLCRVPPCVNPAHLEPVTRAENNRRSGSASALNADKTHCRNGHPLAGDNLYVHPASGKRRCKQCHRARMQHYRDAKAATA